MNCWKQMCKYRHMLDARQLKRAIPIILIFLYCLTQVLQIADQHVQLILANNRLVHVLVRVDPMVTDVPLQKFPYRLLSFG